MPNDKPSRKDDLDIARVIVGEYGLLIGPAGKQSEIVAQAVADGIALGRKEALAMAAKPSGGSKGSKASKLSKPSKSSNRPAVSQRQRSTWRLIHVNAPAAVEANVPP